MMRNYEQRTSSTFTTFKAHYYNLVEHCTATAAMDLSEDILAEVRLCVALYRSLKIQRKLAMPMLMDRRNYATFKEIQCREDRAGVLLSSLLGLLNTLIGAEYYAKNITTWMQELTRYERD